MIEWTTVVTSAVVSAMITSVNFVTTRYLGKMLNRMERNQRKIERNQQICEANKHDKTQTEAHGTKT
jgi:hypothetical protein